MTFDIGRATPEDADAIARLNAFVHGPHVEAHPHYFRPTDRTEVASLLEQWLGAEDVAAFIARDEVRTPIGYLITRYVDRPPTPLHHRRRYLEIDQIAVDLAHRRRGLAHALVELAREEARRRGADRVHLATWTFNEGARAFFESEGFAPRVTQYWQQLD